MSGTGCALATRALALALAATVGIAALTAALAATAALTAAIAAATTAVAATLAGLVLADARHHFGACGLGGCLHDFAARRTAGAAPDRLATHGDRLGALAFFRTEALDLLHRDRLLREAFDFLHEAFFVQAHEAHGLAARTGAAGAADAVHVVFADVRDFVVHDVRQLVDVDAARGDIGGHQGADVAALEAGQRLRAGALALVAVQRHRLDAVLGEELGHAVGAELGAREHEHLAPLVLVDDVREQRLLLAAAHGVDHLRDALHRGVARRDLDALRVLEQRAGEVADLVAEGGREQQALLFLGHQGQDLLHVVDEAHVQHAVGFVQDQHLDLAQVEHALLLQVEQAAGGGHEDVDALLELADLRVHAHAAEDHGGVQLQVLAVRTHRLFDLGREFARGGQHEGTDADAAELVGGAAAHGELVQHRQGEGRGLAGAGLGAAQQVVAVEDHGNGLRLDGGGGVVAVLVHSLQDGGSQLQFVKIHCGNNKRHTRRSGIGPPGVVLG
ncbi:hypothetical protein D3C72_1008450 [compost metagenome]